MSFTSFKPLALVLLLLLSSLLGGCSVASLVGANSEPPPITHDLLAEGQRGLGRFRVQLTVNEPRAVNALSSNRIPIKPGPTELAYFGGAVWTDKLPRLTQLRLIETLEKSRVLRAVGGGTERLRSDFGLSWDIRNFQVEVKGGSARAHVGFYVKLIDEDAGVQVSAGEFSAIVPARDDSVEAGVEALQKAFHASAVKIMRWLVSRRIVVSEARKNASFTPTSAIAAAKKAD